MLALHSSRWLLTAHFQMGHSQRRCPQAAYARQGSKKAPYLPPAGCPGAPSFTTLSQAPKSHTVT
jgi:hypothetical protein